MSNENQHAAQHKDVLKKQKLEQSEVKEVLVFIRKYIVPAAVVIIVICGIVLFDRFLKSSKATKEAKADSALMNAFGPEDLQTIIDEYGSTAAAPIAMMNLAMTKYTDGDYDSAQELYASFLKKYGDHELAAQAELNQIMCRESKGQLGDAQMLYADFSAKHKDSYLAPVAMHSHARCLEALGAKADAKQAYEDLVVAYPGSSWSNLAETRLKVINSELN